LWVYGGNKQAQQLINFFLMEKYVLIIAGGIGRRMNTDIPKQFIPIAGKPVLMHTIAKFRDFDAKMNIVVIIPKEHISLWKDLCTEFNFKIEHQIIHGGKERFYSVKNGLKVVAENSLVLIHDGVRPLVSNETIARVLDMSHEKGNAIPFTDMVQSVRRVQNGKNKAANRSQLKLIQTPQGFHSDLIKAAYAKRYRKSFTDDASVLEATGEVINLVKGNHKNIKITSSTDLHLVDCLMRM
jgi:2-C-methyl-D-erythritol 4-phosphate cytidylyltransferase